MHIEAGIIGGQVGQRDESGQHDEIDPEGSEACAQPVRPLVAERPAPFIDQRDAALSMVKIEAADVMLYDREGEKFAQFAGTAGFRRIGRKQDRYKRNVRTVCGVT